MKNTNNSNDSSTPRKPFLLILLVCLFLLSSLFAFRTFAQFPQDHANKSCVKPSSLLSGGQQSDNGDTDIDQEKETKEQSFFIYFIDVGQGDSSLIICDGHSILIDGGHSKKSDKIYTFLKAKNVTHLDYIVATHPDDDHVGGLAGALNYAAADIALSPVPDDDSQSFQDFRKYLDNQGISITVPEVGDQYSLGSAVITILGPTEIVDSDNNNSIVLRIDHGDNSFLFTGDAEKKEEADILNTNAVLKSTVLKIGHHGSASSTGEDFLSTVAPSAAVISCGAENEYGHPTEEILERLKKKGVQVFRTDLQGDISFYENEGKLFCEVQKNPDADVFVPGSSTGQSTQTFPLQETEPSEETEVTRGNPAESTSDKHEMDYIVNIKTEKFHYPDCRGVKQMKENNKRYVTCDRQDLISQGFEPCGICHP